MTALVFFDVDKTLIKGYTGFYTNIDLIRYRVIRKRHLPKAIWYMCFANYYRDHVIEKMYAPAIADMAGTPMADLMAIGRRCVEQWIWRRLYAEALQQIAHYKGLGIPIILLSSGPYMTIAELARKLAVNGSYAIGPAVENGRVVNQLRTPICYKEGKRVLAEQVAREYGTDLRHCAFYTDSIADLALLEHVGEPFIVNPDRPLRRIAVARQWTILQWTQVSS